MKVSGGLQQQLTGCICFMKYAFLQALMVL
jgi:hypothetical protein